MAASPEIKVGDVGTEYFVPTYDNDLTPANFDPSLAIVKQIIFKMPGAALLCVRDAVAIQQEALVDGTIVAAIWGLRYVVTPADVAAQTDAATGGFHLRPGPIKMEGFVRFSGAQMWASQTVTKDQRGRDLKVVARLT